MALGFIPRQYRDVAIRHRELLKFAMVGGTTWVIDTTIFLILKSTVLEPKPVTAKVISVLVATLASYGLNRAWSFRTRGGRERHQLERLDLHAGGFEKDDTPLDPRSHIAQILVQSI